MSINNNQTNKKNQIKKWNMHSNFRNRWRKNKYKNNQRKKEFRMKILGKN